MKQYKKYLAMAAALLLIIVGGSLLMVDYETVKSAWLGLIGGLMFMGAGAVLGYVLDKKKMLPE
jgi:membrane-bound ClpP family serine protease